MERASGQARKLHKLHASRATQDATLSCKVAQPERLNPERNKSRPPALSPYTLSIWRPMQGPAHKVPAFMTKLAPLRRLNERACVMQLADKLNKKTAEILPLALRRAPYSPTPTAWFPQQCKLSLRMGVPPHTWGSVFPGDSLTHLP